MVYNYIRTQFQKKLKKITDDSLTLILENGESHTVDAIIWAIGRKANVSGFGLRKNRSRINQGRFH